MKVQRYCDKGRLGYRGKKQRYSLFKAKRNRMFQIAHERIVQQICKDNDLRLENVFVDDEGTTWEHLEELGFDLRTTSSDRIFAQVIKDFPLIEK